MMRMLLEIVMVLGLLGGLLFMTKVLAKENRPDQSLPGRGENGSEPPPE